MYHLEEFPAAEKQNYSVHLVGVYYRHSIQPNGELGNLNYSFLFSDDTCTKNYYKLDKF